MVEMKNFSDLIRLAKDRGEESGSHRLGRSKVSGLKSASKEIAFPIFVGDEIGPADPLEEGLEGSDTRFQQRRGLRGA